MTRIVSEDKRAGPTSGPGARSLSLSISTWLGYLVAMDFQCISSWGPERSLNRSPILTS